MGIPYVNVIAGYTNGSIITIDNSLELGTIAIACEEMAIALTALNLNFELTFGSAGALKPGTMANSAAISKNMLIQLAHADDAGNEKQDKKTIYLHGIKSAIDSLAKAQHDMMAIQTLGVSDQISNNSFQKQATIDALKRNDLPEPQPPDLIDTIKEKVVAAETIHATSMLSGTVSKITSNVVGKIEDYILTSGPVMYAQNVIEDGFSYVSSAVTNTIKDFLPTSLVNAAKSGERIAKNIPNPAPVTK